MATRTTKRKTTLPVDASTEEKIKEAARKVFTQKGYRAARTRDIAQEAGINLALLNYYFRSKEKLFDLVMMENLQKFMMGVALIAHNRETTWQVKVDELVSYYMDMLLENPDIPLFVMTEIKNNPEKLAGMINHRVGFLHSPFMQQVEQAIDRGEVVPLPPIQFLANLMGLIVFPFAASGLLQSLGNLNRKQFAAMMNERKQLLPGWIKGMMLVKKSTSSRTSKRATR